MGAALWRNSLLTKSKITGTYDPNTHLVKVKFYPAFGQCEVKTEKLWFYETVDS